MKVIICISFLIFSGFTIGQEKTNTPQPESKSIFSYTFKVNSGSEPQTGQERLVNGIITDQNNEPLPGVTILINKTYKGTHTDFDGKYSIAAKPTDSLIFSYPGFKTQKLKADKDVINITMREDIRLVDDLPYIPNRPRKTAPTVLNIKDVHNVKNSIQFNEQYSFIIGKWKEIEYHGNNGADDYVNKIENGQILTFEKDGSLLIQKDGTTTLGSYEIFPHNEHTLKLHISSSKKEFHYLISNQVKPNYIYLTPVTSDYQFICKEGCGHVYLKMK
jgi:hypothetical protein